MLQLIGFLLCFYLVFKGYEILQIALASSREDKSKIVAWGVMWFVWSIIIAAIFAMMFFAVGGVADHPSR